MFANAMDDATFGLMLGFGGAIADANDAAADWKRYAHEVEHNRDLWMAHAQKLERELADLMDKLAVESSHSAGLAAVVDAFKAHHPDSPLMAPAGVYRSEEVRGRAKLVYHTVYARHFDAEARSAGIADPASRRYD